MASHPPPFAEPVGRKKDSQEISLREGSFCSEKKKSIIGTLFYRLHYHRFSCFFKIKKTFVSPFFQEKPCTFFNYLIISLHATLLRTYFAFDNKKAKTLKILIFQYQLLFY